MIDINCYCLFDLRFAFFIFCVVEIVVLLALIIALPSPNDAVIAIFPTVLECNKKLPVTEQRQKSGRELPASSHTVARQKGVKILVL